VTSNEDFLFAQEAVRLQLVTDAQVKEALDLQRRMAEDLHLDERLSVLLVKRGYIAEEQARRVYAKIQPSGGGPGEIHGYRLLDVIGRGAMGTVYRALHLGLNREVAVKILRPDLAGDRTQVERLKAEAAMLASLDHPNIVRALDAGESHGFPYVVMELVEGETLRDRLRREARLPEAEALRITRALADALERARRMGVVHRDVKPGNILMTRAGEPKLMDLGLAKGPIDLGLTQHGATVGTPQYISPEQALDPKKADTRSDIYSLGATLYAMLAGRPPFDGNTLAEILTKVLYETPAPVRTLRPEVSVETGYLVERMMLRDVALRYRTPADVVADIDRLTHGASIVPAGFTGNWEAYLLRKRIRKTSVLVTVGVVAGLVVAVAYSAYHGSKKEKVEREAIELRVEQALRPVDPGYSRVDLETQLPSLRDLLQRARAAEAKGADALADRVQGLEHELKRFERLQRHVEQRVKPALEARDFARAGTALRQYVDETPAGAARRDATERLASIARESDEALARDRATAVPPAPHDVGALRRALETWAARLAKHSDTPLRRAEEQRVDPALRAALRIEEAVTEGLELVDDRRLERDVAALRLASAADAVRRAARRAEETLREQGDALTKDVAYVAPRALAAIVTEPFEARRRALADRVAEAWRTTRDEADDRDARGDSAGALGLLEQFRDAATLDDWFSELARAARAAHAEVDARTLERRVEAQRALESLAAEAARALRTRDLAAVGEAAARARSLGPTMQSVEDGIVAVERAAVEMAAFEDAAVRALAARVGPDQPRWLPTLRFRGKAQPEQKVELVEVSVPERTFRYQTHKGNDTQPGPRRPIDLREIEDDDLLDLARIDRASAQGRLLRALLALSAPETGGAQFYPAIDALERAVVRFQEAEAEAHPLAAWARAELARRRKEALENESLARSHLATATAAMARGDYSGAHWHLRALRDPALEPAFQLPRTRAAADNAAEISAKLRDIEALKKVGFVEQEWPAVTVIKRSGASDAPVIEATFDFESATQLKSFVAGWARLDLAPDAPSRPHTPEAPARNQALLLNPDAVRETVRDRPLVLASPFLAGPEGAARSIELLYWPNEPFFLAIDLDGVMVGILSDDPQLHPSPAGLPLLEGEKTSPAFLTYGHGRGVRFRTASDLGDPSRWGWDDAHHGHRFVKPALESSEVRKNLAGKYFAFKAQEKPFRVRLTWDPESGARLEVDGVLVHADASEEMRAPRRSRKIQILSMTPCVIDDVKITGRVDPAWIAERTAATGSPRPPGTPSPSAPPAPPADPKEPPVGPGAKPK
jgi:serine/threonine protein kinase